MYYYQNKNIQISSWYWFQPQHPPSTFSTHHRCSLFKKWISKTPVIHSEIPRLVQSPDLIHLQYREGAQQWTIIMWWKVQHKCERLVRKVKMKEWKIGKWKPLWSCLEVQWSIWGSWQAERCLQLSFECLLQWVLCVATLCPRERL